MRTPPLARGLLFAARYSAGRVHLRRWVYPAGFLLAFAFIVASVLVHPSAIVSISVEGRSFQIRTHVGKVEAVLRGAGIKVGEEDLVSPALNTRVSDGDAIIIKKANTTLVLALPDRTITSRTAAETVGEALKENGIALTPDDVITRDGQTVSLDDRLLEAPAPANSHSPYVASTLLRPYGEASFRGGHRPALDDTTAPINLQIRRPLQVHVHEDELSSDLYTREETLGQALKSAGIWLDHADLVSPRLETRVQTGTHVYIKRSRGVMINVDGAERTVRTFRETLGQVLAENGVRLSELDRVEPDLDSYAQDGTSVRITRVAHELVTTEEAIPYSSEMRADPELEIDQQGVVQAGKPGLFKRTTRVIYENGEEKDRMLEREWVEYEPQTRVTTYGTKIVVRELNTPDGPISYWRKMRVYATAYDARGGGKPPDHPAYGITRLGLKAEKGIVAIDPQVIPFYTKMYIPGYGIGLAADTGGGIKGRWIDLYYEEGDTGLWGSRWVDIYLLTPPPNSIRWILP